MRYDLELIEEVGNDTHSVIVDQKYVGHVVCPTNDSVAGVARAIAKGYSDSRTEQQVTDRHKFSVLVWEGNTTNKVVQCWTGMTKYYTDNAVTRHTLSAGY